jgi:hypothetical protein
MPRSGFGDGSPHEKGLSFDPIAQAAGRRDERHRSATASPSSGPTIATRHRHADGVQHRQRCSTARVSARQAVAGGDAGSVMHYSCGMFITHARTGKASRGGCPATTRPAGPIRASRAAPDTF